MFVALVGVLFADTASLISSNFLATDVAANLRLFKPPIRSSLDFLEVKLLGLLIKKGNQNDDKINLLLLFTTKIRVQIGHSP